MEDRKHTQEDISGRMKLMAGIFQKDAQIYDLHNEKIALMQQLYNLEMKMYGRMSKIGNEILEVQHCEVFHGKVREMTESEWKEKSESKNSVIGKLDHYKQQTADSSKDTQKRETLER